MILSVFLGGMLGVGSALVAELMDRRVRSAFDISELLAIPVFAVDFLFRPRSQSEWLGCFILTISVTILTIEAMHKCNAETIINNKMSNEITKIENTASMGALLLDAGKISASDAERIIALQKQKGMLFGDAAKALGLINDDDIQKALSYQFDFPFLTASEENFSQELVAAYQPY